MCKDFLGKVLNIGDKVVFMQKNYRNLVLGEIISLSPKTYVVKHEAQNIGGTETRQFYSQLVKVMI